MHFENRGSYPTREVRRLIELAAVSYDLTRTVVVVRDTNFAYRGLAHPSLWRQRWRGYPARMRYGVEVFIGPPAMFGTPVSNLKTRFRWVRLTDEEYEALPPGIPTRPCFRAGNLWWWEKSVATTAPYGGKKSPLIYFHNWQEAVLGVAAHEFHHISQYQRGVTAREWPCERAAAEALERYRAQKSRESATAPGINSISSCLTQTILS